MSIAGIGIFDPQDESAARSRASSKLTTPYEHYRCEGADGARASGLMLGFRAGLWALG
jgi:hypothetical protein